MWKGCLAKFDEERENCTLFGCVVGEHKGFYNFVGEYGNINYFEVQDFSMNEVPDNYINYAFSYDELCYVSYDGIHEYAINIWKKMKPGANAFGW